MGAMGEAQREGSLIRYQIPGETDITEDFVRYPRMTAPRQLSEGVEAMSGGRLDDCPAGAISSARPSTSHISIRHVNFTPRTNFQHNDNVYSIFCRQ